MPEKIEIINNWNLKKLFDELENGNIKIPRFQRLYVWERAKIVKLLNSIYSQYPIGSFFLWLAGQGFEHFAKEDPELGLPRVPSFGIYQFILDGQQRITSLYVALKGKHLGGVDYSVICFNLTREEFVIPRLKSEQHNIPAWKLFDTHEYAKVYAQYVVEDIAKAEAWGRCQRAFSDYPLSIIKSMNMGLEEVVEIFERINQGGKRLTLFDLVHASTWRDAPRFDIREEIGSFHKLNPNMAVFGTLASEVFTQSLALNVYHDCKNKNQLDLTAEACATHWGKSMECLKLAIDYARGKLGVRTIEFMPYQSMLSIIQHYFYAVGEKTMQPAHDQYIQNWFWTATFSARYSNATLTKMKDDADWIRDLAAGNLEERTFPIAISTR